MAAVGGVGTNLGYLIGRLLPLRQLIDAPGGGTL